MSEKRVKTIDKEIEEAQKEMDGAVNAIKEDVNKLAEIAEMKRENLKKVKVSIDGNVVIFRKITKN